MYSVVLMMAMTTAPESPNWFFHHHGCWSCHGCYGCSGCYGGCYSWASCYGCGGWASCYGCYGCYGCCGGYALPYSCVGYGIYGGASYTWPTPYYGGMGTTYGYGTPIAPVYSPSDKGPPKTEEKLGEPKKSMIMPNNGRVIVRLPADARLYANDVATTLTTGERWFTTPVIEQGKDFQYTLKVEYVRDGKTVTDTQVVKVRAGTISEADFTDKTIVAVKNEVRAETAVSVVKVIAPADAKLFVENRQELPAGAKEFKTPELVKGREYAYSFRAELNKDGQKQTQTQRVVFKAGEPVTVDFTDMDSPRTASK